MVTSMDQQISAGIVNGAALFLVIVFLFGCAVASDTVMNGPDSKANIADPASVDIPVEKRPLVPGKSIGNLHTHTLCLDGKNSYEEMVQEALILEFSFIAITDHVYGGSALCEDVIRQCREEKRLLCIPGMEVTGRVHLLAIGIHKETDKKLSVKKQIEEIHKQGGLAIAAHPFRNGNTYTDEELFETGLDAVECKGIPSNREKEFYAKLKERNIPCVYNTDAHIIYQLMLTWNSCEGEIANLEDLKKALKTGKCGKR